jgi:anti-sigma regulatory factor (Ser/Thr protein kinase)
MKKVLLIGSHTELLTALQNADALKHCRIVNVQGEFEALQKLRSQAFDVLLTDPASPACRDLAYLKLLCGNQPGLKVILLLPEATTNDVIASLRANVFACFTAPFDASEVIPMLARALEVTDWRDGIEIISASPNWLALRVACRRLTAERLVQFMTEFSHDLPTKERGDLLIAFREILLNAMEHGAGFDPEMVVEVSAIRSANEMIFLFRDPGPGFRLDALPHAAISNEPDDPAAHLLYRMEQGLRPGGFGILMVRELVDEVIFNESGNEVVLIKRIATS